MPDCWVRIVILLKWGTFFFLSLFNFFFLSFLIITAIFSYAALGETIRGPRIHKSLMGVS